MSKAYIRSVAMVLALTAFGKLYSSFGMARILMSNDPIFHIRFKYLFLLAGFIEIVIATFCWSCKSERLNCILIAWLGTLILGYRVGSWWVGYHGPCHCLGNLTGALHISNNDADAFMKLVLVYLLVGSFFILLRSGRSTQIQTDSDAYKPRHASPYS